MGAARDTGPRRRTSTAALRAVILLALENLNARERPVDTEDVTVACHDIAPSLVSMKRYPQHPRIDLVYYALKNLKKDGRATGSLQAGWTLTLEGANWLRDNEAEIDAAVKEGLPQKRSGDPGSAQTEVARVREAKAYQDYELGQRRVPSRREVAELLRCTAGSRQSAFRASLERLIAYAEELDATDVRDFALFVRSSHPALFGDT